MDPSPLEFWTENRQFEGFSVQIAGRQGSTAVRRRVGLGGDGGGLLGAEVGEVGEVGGVGVEELAGGGDGVDQGVPGEGSEGG